MGRLKGCFVALRSEFSIGPAGGWAVGHRSFGPPVVAEVGRWVATWACWSDDVGGPVDRCFARRLRSSVVLSVDRQRGRRLHCRCGVELLAWPHVVMAVVLCDAAALLSSVSSSAGRFATMKTPALATSSANPHAI